MFIADETLNAFWKELYVDFKHSKNVTANLPEFKSYQIDRIFYFLAVTQTIDQTFLHVDNLRAKFISHRCINADIEKCIVGILNGLKENTNLNKEVILQFFYLVV